MRKDMSVGSGEARWLEGSTCRNLVGGEVEVGGLKGWITFVFGVRVEYASWLLTVRPWMIWGWRAADENVRTLRGAHGSALKRMCIFCNPL
jgi:hypothetical protein